MLAMRTVRMFQTETRDLKQFERYGIESSSMLRTQLDPSRARFWDHLKHTEKKLNEDLGWGELWEIQKQQRRNLALIPFRCTYEQCGFVSDPVDDTSNGPVLHRALIRAPPCRNFP